MCTRDIELRFSVICFVPRDVMVWARIILGLSIGVYSYTISYLDAQSRLYGRALVSNIKKILTAW